MQHKLTPRHVARHDRRSFESDEVLKLVTRFPKVHSNVGTGEQSSQSGDLSTSDPGPHDPKPCITYQVRLGFLNQLDCHNNPLPVLAEFDRFDFPDVHV